MSSRQASMVSSVPYTLVADATAGPGDPAVDAMRQLTSLRNSALACTRARLSWTHSESMTRRPSPSLVDRAQSVTSASADMTGAAEVSATRSWLSWLVISGQPLCSSPTRLTGRDPHVGVVGGARGHPGDRAHRCPGEAVGVGRDDDDGQSLVPGRLRIGPAGQPDVVRVLDQAGPHLLAVDHVAVAVTDRAGTQRGQVRASARLGVADGEVQLPRRDPGQEPRPSARTCRSA